MSTLNNSSGCNRDGSLSSIMDQHLVFPKNSVQAQLQELVELQHKQIVLLKKKLADQKKKIDFSHFQAVVKELQDEKEAHAKTEAKLEKVRKELELAINEIDAQKRKNESERERHELIYSAMKTKSMRESRRNVKLENQCNVMSRVVEKNAEVIHSREQHIHDLSDALHDTRTDFDKQLKDLFIQQEHNNYIAKVLGHYDKHTKGGHYDKHPPKGVTDKRPPKGGSDAHCVGADMAHASSWTHCGDGGGRRVSSSPQRVRFDLHEEQSGVDTSRKYQGHHSYQHRRMLGPHS